MRDCLGPVGSPVEEVLGSECSGKGDASRAIVGNRQDLGKLGTTFADNSGMFMGRRIEILGIDLGKERVRCWVV